MVQTSPSSVCGTIGWCMKAIGSKTDDGKVMPVAPMLTFGPPTRGPD
jgi:hypothetical protein